MVYDDTHNMTNYAIAYGSGSPAQQFAIEYDPVWQLPASIEDAEGYRMKTIEYTNGVSYIEKAFYNETNSYNTCYSYITTGLLKAITNANEHVIDFDYDLKGNRISIIPECGPSITNTYNALGFVQTLEVLAEDGSSTGRIMHHGRDVKVERVSPLILVSRENQRPDNGTTLHQSRFPYFEYSA